MPASLRLVSVFPVFYNPWGQQLCPLRDRALHGRRFLSVFDNGPDRPRECPGRPGFSKPQLLGTKYSELFQTRTMRLENEYLALAKRKTKACDAIAIYSSSRHSTVWNTNEEKATSTTAVGQGQHFMVVFRLCIKILLFLTLPTLAAPKRCRGVQFLSYTRPHLHGVVSPTAKPQPNFVVRFPPNAFSALNLLIISANALNRCPPRSPALPQPRVCKGLRGRSFGFFGEHTCVLQSQERSNGNHCR